jgi:hypothetical protein
VRIPDGSHLPISPDFPRILTNPATTSKADKPLVRSAGDE